MTLAICYFRTSTATNVEGDSVYRQARAVEAYAAAAGYDIDSCFWDPGDSGADPIETRPGFAALLSRASEVAAQVASGDGGAAEANAPVVLVESTDRFARSMLAQELGLARLTEIGVRLLTSSGIDLTDSSTPERLLYRHMGGALIEYDKSKVVQRLRQGRDRVRAQTGRCEGRKAHTIHHPGLAREARRLARRNPKTGKVRSLRDIAAELAGLGFTAKGGNPYSHTVVARILSKPAQGAT